MEMSLAAKDFISLFFYRFSDNMMSIIQENGVMSLDNMAGVILALCAVAELIYIIKDQIEGRPVLMKTGKFMFYLVLTLMVFGKMNYSGLRLTSSLPSDIRPKGDSDLLRDSHAFLRFYFDEAGKVLTGGASGGNPGSEAKTISELVQKNGMLRAVCNTEVSEASKDKCRKDRKDMTIPDLIREYEARAESSILPLWITKIGLYLNFESVFLFFTNVLYAFRFIGYLIVLFGYILTVVMTYLTLKLLFPFILLEKTRGQIIAGVRFYLSTSAIELVLGFLEYISILAVGSLVQTTANSMDTNWSEFTFSFFLTMILTIIIFGVEIALYFRVPRLTKEIFELNIGALVTISETAKDGLRLGMQLVGLSFSGGTFGAVAGAAKLGGLRNPFGGSPSSTSSPSGGPGAPTGGGSGGSNLAPSAPYQEGRRDDTGRYNGRFSNPDQGSSISRPAPESVVNTEELNKLKLRDRFQKNNPEKEDGSNNQSSPRGEAPEKSVRSQVQVKTSNESGSVGAPPKSSVNSELLKGLGDKGKGKGRNSGEEQSKLGKLGTGAARVVKNTAASSLDAVKKYGPEVIKSAATASLQAAAGDLEGAFQTAVKPIATINNDAKNSVSKTFNQNEQKYWTTKGLSADDLYTDELGGEFNILRDRTEYDNLNHEVDGMQSYLEELRAKAPSMTHKFAGGKYDQEQIDAFYAEMANIEKNLNSAQERKVQMESDYEEAKVKLLDSLKNESQEDKIVNLFGVADNFQSDTLRSILSGQDKASHAEIAKLKKIQSDKYEKIKAQVEKELATHGRISSKTEELIINNKTYIPNNKTDEIIGLISKSKSKK